MAKRKAGKAKNGKRAALPSAGNKREGAHELRLEFTNFFVGNDGRLQPHGNSGFGRTVVPLRRRILQQTDPLLFDVLIGWEERGELSDPNGKTLRVHDVAMRLVELGLWEGAWSLRQLHYDQLLKQEVASGLRCHKGEPACGLAIIAREIGSPSLCHHYASISSAGDIYWQHELDLLKYGGFGPTMLEQFESDEQQRVFRNRVQSQMESADARHRPLYLNKSSTESE